jgi:glyceraldehyde 3-phosphate dehydrogenase
MLQQELQETYTRDMVQYVNQERDAVKLLNLIGKLLFEQSIELVFFRDYLVNITVTDVLELVKYGKKVVKRPIDLKDVVEMAEIIEKMKLAPAKLDIARLTAEWTETHIENLSKEEFLNVKLKGFNIDHNEAMRPRDVVLFGLGRIGRLAARELIKQFGKGQQLRLRAIVTRSDDEATIVKRAALLRNDSVHGKFAGTIEEDLENKQLIINGQRVHMIGTHDPGSLDYTRYGIEDALLIDNTGAYRDRDALGIHLKAKGISKVLLTAPGKEVPNVVYGINHKDLDIDNETIFSAASCTTNAISPVLKVIHDALEVECGHIETIHAYTNDQNLLDNMHKKPRRGRSAAINMVLTSTGAGKAVSKVIPDLEGKLTANAVRVPTPNGSLAIMKLKVKKPTSVEQINEILRKAALEGDLVNQINYQINPELVSNDIIGNTCASVFDSKNTIVHSDGVNIVLYTWYDNEFGYTKQVIRMAKYIAKVRRLHYY